MYFKNRTYSQDVGRFLNRNPWGYIHTQPSLYDCVANNPTYYTEPTSTLAPPVPVPVAPPIAPPVPLPPGNPWVVQPLRGNLYILAFYTGWTIGKGIDEGFKYYTGEAASTTLGNWIAAKCGPTTTTTTPTPIRRICCCLYVISGEDERNPTWALEYADISGNGCFKQAAIDCPNPAMVGPGMIYKATLVAIQVGPCPTGLPQVPEQ
jgi:hypothetical protein